MKKLMPLFLLSALMLASCGSGKNESTESSSGDAVSSVTEGSDSGISESSETGNETEPQQTVPAEHIQTEQTATVSTAASSVQEQQSASGSSDSGVNAVTGTKENSGTASGGTAISTVSSTADKTSPIIIHDEDVIVLPEIPIGELR